MSWQGISSKLGRWMHMDAKSREFFNPALVTAQISIEVYQKIGWTETDWILLSGAPVGSTVSVDLWGRAIQMVVVNDTLMANPMIMAVLFDGGFTYPQKIVPNKLEIAQRFQGEGWRLGW